MCVLLLSHLNKMLNVCTPLISPQQNVKCVYSSYLTSTECYVCTPLISPQQNVKFVYSSYLALTEC